MVDEFVVKNGLISPSVDGGAITSTSLNVNGLVYPSTDGTLNQVIVTDGNGALSFATQSGGGGGGATEERFRLNYDAAGESVLIDQTTAGINTTNIASAAGGIVELTFTGHLYPPIAIYSYGYEYTNNDYLINAVGRQGLGGVTQKIAGGGVSGTPTAMGAFAGITLTLTLSESQTDASRGFGTVTHAWIYMIFGD